MHVIFIAALAIVACFNGAHVSGNSGIHEESQASSEPCHVVRPAPKHSICQQPGAVKTPHEVKTAAAKACTTLRQCSDKCIADYKCLSFGFDSATRVCTFYSKSLRQQAFHHDKSRKTVFSDRACYHCTGCAATLINGDFESGSLSPWVLAGSPGVSKRIVSPGAHGSKYAAGFSTPPSSTGGQLLVFLYQNITWCSHRNYAIEFDYQLVKGTTDNYFQASNGQASGPNAGSNVYEFEDVPPGKWNHGKGAMYPTSSTHGYVKFEGFSTADYAQTFAVDNVVLRLVND